MKTDNSWEVCVWPSNGTKERLAAGAFDASNFTGPLRYELWRDNASVRVVQPDGKAVVIPDERIGRISGRWMPWELYKDGGVDSARIQSWRAG